MAGRDEYFGRNSEYDAYNRNRRELDERGERSRMSEDRSFGWSRGEGGYGAGRTGSRYDQDRTGYGRGGRPDWQDRDWEGGSPGLSRGYEADERRMEERRDERRARDFGGGRSRSFRQGRSDYFGYGGQEYGMEARGSQFARSPEPVRQVTDADEDHDWRDRFGDDGRPHPRFDDDRERRYGRRDDDRGGWFGRDDDRERRFGGRDDERGHMRWRDEGGVYGDTRLDRRDRGMNEYGLPADYGYHGSVDPFEAEDSRRRQEEVRRRGEEDRRRRADLERQEREYRADQGRRPWDRNW